MDVSINLESVRRDIREAEEKLAKLKAVEEYVACQAASNGKPTKKKSVTKSSGQAGIAEKALTMIGKPAKIAEIVDVAIEHKWLTLTGKRRNLENSMYGAMTRRKDLFFLIERGTWELVSRRKS